MARPVWSGALTFGLVSLPIAIFPATDDHTVRFHQLQRGTADRVRTKRVNERTGNEVDFQDIVKGYPVAEGDYVVVEPDELDQISPSRPKTIDVTGFVDLDQVEPVFFDRTYYIGPKGAEFAKIYKLLTEALEASNRAGIALFAMRGKEYLTAVRAHNGLLELHTMHFADEIRDPREEIDSLPTGQVKVTEKELDTARQLIDMLAVDWDPTAYRNTFEEQVRQLVKDKAEGREIAVSKGAPLESTNVVDLMDVLQRSVDSARGSTPKPAAKKSSPRMPKASAGTKSTSAKTAKKAPAAKKRTGAAREDLSQMTKAELYERAAELNIPKRSAMSRDQLQDAVAGAGRGRLRSAT
jgi:DNA end-binding protein Ku